MALIPQEQQTAIQRKCIAMKHEIASIDDLTLDTFEDVMRGRGTAEITPDLAGKIDKRREEFMTFVEENRAEHLYGITTRQHTGAKRVLNDDELKEFGGRLPATAALAGPAYPDRIVRGILLARVADYINGTSCVRSSVVQHILDMLERDELPYVPSRGNGECGDILSLGSLFQKEFNGTLDVGEGMTMINGSPISAALLADAVITTRPYAETLEKVIALAAFAGGVPLMHYDEQFETLWHDEYMAASIRNIRENILAGGPETTRDYQGPVSFRSAPRMLGWQRRTQEMCEQLVSVDMKTSTSNPAFFGPEIYPPYGKVCSNGGYHSAYGGQCLNALNRSVAELTQLVTSLNNRVLDMPGGLQEREDDPRITCCFYASCGWSDEARFSTTQTVLSLAAGGQGDTGTNDPIAWRNVLEAARAFEYDTGCLAVSAAHLATYKDMDVQGPIGELQKQVMEIWPVGTESEDFLGKVQDIHKLLFPESIFTAEQTIK